MEVNWNGDTKRDIRQVRLDIRKYFFLDGTAGNCTEHYRKYQDP